MRSFLSLTLLLLLILSGCAPMPCVLEPCISYQVPELLVEQLPSAFEPLSAEERKQDWGKEMLIATVFAKEMDLYRAITSYKRAKVLIPLDQIERRQQIEYDIIASYYLGAKYQDVVETFECSDLKRLSPSFPALDNLILMLYDAYDQIGEDERSNFYFELIEKFSPETAAKLTLSSEVIEGDIDEVESILCENDSYPDVSFFLAEYRAQEKSISKARFLNAVLPGAGYYYVGQKKSAATSFLINALFTAAAYQFFHRGYVAAGVITTSFEMGWYFGGINGAGLAAKEYNERYYNSLGKSSLSKSCLFPVLMFETVF